MLGAGGEGEGSGEVRVCEAPCTQNDGAFSVHTFRCIFKEGFCKKWEQSCSCIILLIKYWGVGVGVGVCFN